jgi:hypothetical protein
MDKQRPNERGSSRLKFLLVMIVVASVGYASYLFIPVAYQNYLFRDLMQHDVDVAAASGYPVSWVEEQLTKSLPEYDIPKDAVISSMQRDSRVEVRVRYTRLIQFPGYTYEYEFDHTARSTAFLTFK